MLSRPEIGTREHILLWLSSKPEDQAYEWISDLCPWAQYAGEWLNFQPDIMGGNAPTTPELYGLNNFARVRPHTFGALSKRARELWN